MNYEKCLQERVKRYCHYNNIPYKNGGVPSIYKGEIEAYLERSLGQEKRTQRNRERITNYREEIKKIINKMLRGFVTYPIEVYLWEALVSEGAIKEAVKHYKSGKYEIDIAYPENKLAIECVRAEYHRDSHEQMDRDARKDKYLARKGWQILRFKGLEIRRNVSLCVQSIKERLESKEES